MAKPAARDWLIIAGLGFLFYGLWQINPAWAWIVDGGIMIGLAVMGWLLGDRASAP